MSSVSSYFFNVATRKFKITHEAHIIFLVDSARLGHLCRSCQRGACVGRRLESPEFVGAVSHGSCGSEEPDGAPIKSRDSDRGGNLRRSPLESLVWEA